MKLENLLQNTKYGIYALVTVNFVLVAFYVIWFYGINDQSLSTNSNDWGVFGDFVGGILNPLVAFFAVCLLSISIVIQKEELSETTKALVESQQAQTKQAQLALVAAKIQSLNMRLSVISSEMSALMKHRNTIMSTNNPKQLFLNEDAKQISATKFLNSITPRIAALRDSQTELVRDIDLLLREVEQ
jgi:hypothetical protein